MRGSTFSFKNKLWIYPGESANWHFVYLPDKESEEIRKKMRGTSRRGFGAVKVEVELGSSNWKTSIFPTKEGPYLLPIKASVRKSEGIYDGDNIALKITLI